MFTISSANIELTKLFEEYNRIIQNEELISDGHFIAPICSAKEVLGIVQQLECVVTSGFVMRCCKTRYGDFSPGTLCPESVSAHTNLLQFIVDRVLFCHFGPYFEKAPDGFTYREIMEVARRHDLPENVIGDIADNGNRDDEGLLKTESVYLNQFARASAAREKKFEDKVRQLQFNMNSKRNFSGRLLYAADKASAILTTLGYDSMGAPCIMSTAFAGASAKEAKAMSLCEFRTERTDKFGNYQLCRASEMWTIDYFKIRKLYQYDDTGIITAILIIESLIVNGKWYDWREKDYAKIPN